MRNNSKKIALSILTASLALPVFGQNNKLPNIVLIFTDDQGYGDLGCYGAEGFSTPTIDSLAEHGVKFTNFYVSQAVSSASRASLLTGCYSNRIGITGALSPNSSKGLSDKELTIAEMLKERGYATGMFGKWHLGHHKKFLPLQHGFDEFVGLPYSNDMWPVTYDNKPIPNKKSQKGRYPTLQLIEGNSKTREFNSIEDQDSITSILTDKAVNFIDRHAEEPFFLYFPHPMPHVPLGVSKSFAGKSEYGRYGDVIMEIDWSVKQVVKALEKNGVLENTIIIFTSDNGPWKNFGDHAGETAGLREGKGTAWEGGQRVPCIINWPGHTPDGMTINNIASTIDILPTIAKITGGTLPEHTIDGINILPLIMGDTAANPRNEFCYYYNNSELQAVRKGDWKLVFPHTYRSYIGVEAGKNGLPGKYNYSKSELELYNITNDPFEKDNVISNNLDIVKDLEILADSYRNELGDFLTGVDGIGLREPGYTYELPDKVSNLATGADVELMTDFNIRYTGRGANGLVDGIVGRPDFQDRSWQAYSKNNLEAIIRFKDTTAINSITFCSIKSEESWIFLPKSVSVYYSIDGENFEFLKSIDSKEFIKTDIDKKYNAIINVPCKAVALKITAENIGVCPKGHAAEGKPAWLFVDEIIVR